MAGVARYAPAYTLVPGVTRILFPLGEVDLQQSYPYPGSVHGVGVDRCVHPGAAALLSPSTLRDRHCQGTTRLGGRGGPPLRLLILDTRDIKGAALG